MRVVPPVPHTLRVEVGVVGPIQAVPEIGSDKHGVLRTVSGHEIGMGGDRGNEG